MVAATQESCVHECLVKLTEWTQKHSKAALITAITCLALGIACVVVVAKVTLVTAAAIALIGTAVTAFSLSTALFLSYCTSQNKTPNFIDLTAVMRQMRMPPFEIRVPPLVPTEAMGQINLDIQKFADDAREMQLRRLRMPDLILEKMKDDQKKLDQFADDMRKSGKFQERLSDFRPPPYLSIPILG